MTKFNYIKTLLLIIVSLISLGCNNSKNKVSTQSSGCSSTSTSCSIQPSYIVSNSAPFFIQ